jgi:hypothetical protein
MRDYVSVYLKMALEDLSDDEIQTLIGLIMKIVRSLQNKMSQQAIVEAETIRSISIE